MTREDCLFCDPAQSQVIGQTAHWYIRLDNYPANPGHVEIVPFRHVESAFHLTSDEAAEFYGALRYARRLVEARYGRPDGYTIGINEGRAAGRSIDHLHVHLIPRHHGDVPDPRGGIRRAAPNCNPDEWAAATPAPRASHGAQAAQTTPPDPEPSPAAERAAETLTGAHEVPPRALEAVANLLRDAHIMRGKPAEALAELFLREALPHIVLDAEERDGWAYILRKTEDELHEARQRAERAETETARLRDAVTLLEADVRRCGQQLAEQMRDAQQQHDRAERAEAVLAKLRDHLDTAAAESDARPATITVDEIHAIINREEAS